MVTRAGWLLCLGFAVAGCKPDFGNPASLVTEHRILATKADPAEVRPGDNAIFRALVVSPDGTEAMPSIDWSLCVAPKPLDENNIVTSACLDGGNSIQGFGSATAMATAMVPPDACSLFGPDPPPQAQGQPPLRPRDPDITGGYYQPLRLVEGDVTAFALERITCDLARGGAVLAIQYAMTYQANQNPALTPLAAAVNGAAAQLTALPAGKDIDFTVGWTPASVETFPVFDLLSQNLQNHREGMRVSWFATAGSFAHEITGRDEHETDTTTVNRWTAPKTPGVVHLWVVLRDSRGGVDFAGYDLTVQ
jgi:hypothetical protein